MPGLHVTPVPALADNYAYLLRDPAGPDCAVVDPGEARPVLEALRAVSGRLVALLLTHHHADHAGGVRELLAALGPVPVFGSARDRERLPALDHPLEDGDPLEIAGETGRALWLPGHTRGSLAYYFPESGHLFCGDVLFGAGCGRIFEGTPGEMQRSLSRLAALPDATMAWCGHEYTRQNLAFARTVDPGNRELALREATLVEPTVPLDLGLEKRTNPFLRWLDPALLVISGQTDPVQVFAALRRWKDAFRSVT